MKIAVVVAISVALLTPVSASATHKPTQKARIAHLLRANRQLRHRLHTATLARNRAKNALVAERSAATALESQLAQRTASLNSALAQVASLRAQLAAIPTPLDVAIAQVQHEVSWAEGGAPAYSHGALLSLAALGYVVGHVSVGAYGYLEVKGLPLPAHTPNAILGAQAGICGETSLAFAAIMQHLGYQARRITFYWTLADGTPDGHTGVEIYYDGGWHYFDPTFGQYWTDSNGSVQSITDARANAGTRHKDVTLFTNLVEDPWFAGDDTAFQTDPGTNVVVGGDPFVG